MNAKGTLRVYRIGSADKILRDRPWPAPDLPVLSKEAFLKLFPHDAYGQDAGKKEQARGKLVYSSPFDTASGDSILLPVDKHWQVGDYFIEVESKDEFDQPVTGKRKFGLRDAGYADIPQNTVVFYSLDKANYYVGDKAAFTIGTALKDATITIDIEKTRKVVSTQVIHLSNDSYTLRIPIDQNDIGGFAIHYHLVNFNDFKTGTQIVNVSKKEEQLQIETATFRDKLLPGARETWNFKIKGPNRGKLEAEVLAAMYDASLDQFKPHKWRFNPFPKPTYYSRYRSYANNSFGNNTFVLRNLSSPRCM